MPDNNADPASSSAPSQKSRSIQLTPELVKKIADKVYALMLAEIKIERERRRSVSQPTPDSSRGHYGA
jgi:hypothetical protein